MKLSYTVYLQISFDPAGVKVSVLECSESLDPQHDYNLYTYLEKKTVNVHMHIPRQNLKAFLNGLLLILEVTRQMMKSPTLLRGPVTK